MLLILAIGCNYGLLAATQKAESSAETLLLKQLDEERMAFRLYTELGEVHPGMKPFQNIPDAENRHFNALAEYAKANFPEIEIAGIESEFQFAATQELYETWLEKGKTSRQAAAEVGVELEKMDIADIDHFLAQKPDAELTVILENLKEGSQKHLAAFQRHLPGDLSDDNVKGRMKSKGKSFKPSCCSRSHE
jgi:hypothetical protein